MPVMDEFKEEREALKHGTPKEKLTYFLDYYKWHVVTAAVIIFMIVSLASQILTRKDTVFFAAMINGTELQSADEYQRDFAEYAGLDIETNDIVFDTTMHIASGGASYYDPNTVASGQKLMVYIASGEIDAFVTDEDTIAQYANNEFLMDLRDLLTQEQILQYRPYFYYIDQAVVDEKNAAEDALDYSYIPVYPDPSDPSLMTEPVPVGIYLDNSSLTEYYHYTGERVVAGVAVNTARPESASKFIDFVMR